MSNRYQVLDATRNIVKTVGTEQEALNHIATWASGYTYQTATQTGATDDPQSETTDQ